MRRVRRVGFLLGAVAIVAAACSGSEGTEPAETTTTTPAVTTTPAPTTTSTAPPSVTDSVVEGGPTTITTTQPPDQPPPLPPDVAERVDLLTFAQGTLFVSQTGLASGSAGRALRVVDGDPNNLTVSTDAGDPVELIYKLPAETVFDRFAIPNVVEEPGNVTFYQSVVVSGSLEGPDTGYQVLATFELETHGPDRQVTELTPADMTPVRWVKINLEGGINIEEGDDGRTNLQFTELIGNGTQDEVPLSDAFTGIWDFRLTERLDLKGMPLELKQVGASISGCLDTIAITGSVNGSIARATGVDTVDGRPAAFIFVADGDVIEAAYSFNNSIFGARTAVVDPDVTSTPCSETPPARVACGAIVYVNFDVNSAVIRSESQQVLADLYDGLVADGVTMVAIEGHTSTEGTDDYNQDLSERRAQAVVDDLVARGFDGASISAVGLGESEPLISPDPDETSRSLNRRVEIDCG